MNNTNKVIVECCGANGFRINYQNPYTGLIEKYIFPEYKRGSNRKRTHEISEDCYHFLKDETSTFKEGYLRVVVEETQPEPVKEVQTEYEKEVIEITPEYEDNVITKDEIEKIMKGTKASISKRLSKIEAESQKQYVIEVIKELKIKNVDKLREVVHVFYGDEIDFDLIFPPSDSE